MLIPVLLAGLALDAPATPQRRLNTPPTLTQGRQTRFALPDGAKLEFDVGDVSAGYTIAYVTPPGMAPKKLKWDVSKVRGATAVIFQVSRTPFGLDRNPDFSPRDIVSQGRENGAFGANNVSVGQIAAEAGYQVPENPGRLRQPDLRQAFLRGGGHFGVYVRVIPVASTADPRPVGLASPALQIIYAKAPPSGVVFTITNPNARKKASPVECLSIKYVPFKEYCFVHPNPSVCAQVGEGKPWYEETFSFLVEAWDWTSETYQKAKKAVVDIAASALPFVPREAFEVALDGALAACGVPPNIPNLDQLMEHGADYLAGEVVAQIGPPVAGDLAKEQIKKAILTGAKAAAKKVGSAGPDKACQYNIEWPYVVAMLRNKTAAPVGPLYVQGSDWTGIYATTSLTQGWDGRLFKTSGQAIASLSPGAALPVCIPLMPDMHQNKHYVQGVHKPVVFWNDYNTVPTEISLTVAATFDPSVSTLSVKAGKRLVNKPFEQKF